MKEHAVHSLTYLVVASEREREVADATTHVHLRHLLVYGATSLYKSSRIVVVLWHTCSHSQHVRVEDNVLCWETYAFQQFVGAASHRYLAFVGVCLSFFIEEHHHRCCSHRVDIASLLKEFLLALFQRYRVDD